MKLRVWAMVAAAGLVLAACGGGGSPQDEVADMMLDTMQEEDVAMDEDCVRDAAQELSDDDAQKILDAGPDGEPQDLSPEATAATGALINCVDTDALIDELVDQMVDQSGAENVDVDCLKDAFRDLDLASFDEGDPEMMSAVLECISLGG